jgi:hypothetical protein
MAITSFPQQTLNNNYTSASAPWNLQVSRGLVSGCTAINIFAASNNVGTGTLQTLWENTGTTSYAFPSTAAQMHITSSSATDTGTASVLINGLDSSWNLISETITLNGTTVLTTVNSYLRVNNMVMVTPATGQTSNVGTITLKNLANSVTYAQITPAYGRTAMSIYSVPSGYTLWVNNINIFSGDGNGGNAYINYQAKATNNNVTPANTITALNTTFGLVYSVIRTNPFPYTQKSDVQWQFSTNTGTHSVGLILEGVLISNTAP